MAIVATSAVFDDAAGPNPDRPDTAPDLELRTSLESFAPEGPTARTTKAAGRRRGEAVSHGDGGSGWRSQTKVEVLFDIGREPNLVSCASLRTAAARCPSPSPRPGHQRTTIQQVHDHLTKTLHLNVSFSA